MVLKITLNKGKGKGKKRIIDSEDELEPPVASTSEPPHPTKRPKRAETRPCPICDEQIPLRLLGKHAELESERVQEIISHIGDSSAVHDEWDEPGPSSRNRRSAVKANKSIKSRPEPDTISQSAKAIQTVKRHRKQRLTKLKELTKDDSEDEVNYRSSWMRRMRTAAAGAVAAEGVTCPVCAQVVRGDADVVDGHVDACLAHEARRVEEVRMREMLHRQALEQEVWEGGSEGGYVGDIRGAGFETRNDEECVDEEIDIDGDDHTFGEAQFTEGDIVPVSRQEVDEEDLDVDVEIEGSDDESHAEQRTLRDLVAAGKVMKQPTPSQSGPAKTHAESTVMGVSDIDSMDLAIAVARRKDDKSTLIQALENKIKQLESATVSTSAALLCRICIDPYTEPTVSTGCWHTCCRECWLRCLGSTKLCPICKRITGASDLRRVYL